LDKDRLINLLPAEYLPEPEFKAFPIFAAALIILTILFVWLSYQRDDRELRQLRAGNRALQTANAQKLVEAQEFIDVQANARFITSYLAIVPSMIVEAPDYWEIYNEIERLLPEDTWVTSVTFRPGRRAWPDVVVGFLSKGYGFYGPLATYDSFKGTAEKPTRFRNIRMAGYSRTYVGGAPATVYQIQMQVRFPQELASAD
jgi:hypothetical protein